jgi:hypothetical protein
MTIQIIFSRETSRASRITAPKLRLLSLSVASRIQVLSEVFACCKPPLDERTTWDGALVFADMFALVLIEVALEIECLVADVTGESGWWRGRYGLVLRTRWSGYIFVREFR